MGKLTFYSLELSPPCRNVIMVLKALGLKYELVTVDITKGEQKTEEYIAINPRGKVPALKDGDFVVYESRAIAAYLVNMYGDKQSSLYPSQPQARATVDQMLYVSENTHELLMKYIDVGGVLFGNSKPNEENLVHVTKALELYEKYLSKTEYVAANYMTIADFFMISGVTMLEMPGYTDISAYPKTEAWAAKMRALPYFDEVNKGAMEKFAEMYTAKCKKN